MLVSTTALSSPFYSNFGRGMQVAMSDSKRCGVGTIGIEKYFLYNFPFHHHIIPPPSSFLELLGKESR
ncbi:hypothetical protein KFK09_015312 [Dendrobium nobile]|uniref:Uncharacterized protein n=1 Tax=Dendrobium nobile TaxID=94219 RepID=A0A8T3B4G0_DENNO|nr:hypothetical protein KFK09_015312 [Dendrobium nobile]